MDFLRDSMLDFNGSPSDFNGFLKDFNGFPEDFDEFLKGCYGFPKELPKDFNSFPFRFP